MTGLLYDIVYITGQDIDFIDVLKGVDATTLNNAGNGIIAIYTRTASFDQNINIKCEPGIMDFIATSFYTAREFYAPDYTNTFDETTKQDIRTALHWEPKIVRSEESIKATISFFTSGTCCIYGIKIEGLTNSGMPFYHLST